MARRFLDDIRADLNNLLVTGGETTAPALNALLQDMIDSSIQDESVIFSNDVSPNIPTTDDWIPLTTVYDQQLGGDGDFLKPDAAAGYIEGSSTAGFSYTVRGVISMNDLSQNQTIEFAILKDGVAVGYIGTINGAGNNRAVQAFCEHTSLSTEASARFQIGARTPSGAQDIDVLTIGMSAIILPTNNP